MGVGLGQPGGYTSPYGNDTDELAQRLCSGERAHGLEARIHHETEEGDIAPETARWLHQMVDRNENYQRGVCRSGNDWQLHDVARRYDWIDQRLHQEEDRAPDW